ncbi:putative hydro-lyase [Zavarzinella formosa]|uniref:putative hydro-lyase n=1 Tax=Zavarzinella formosa TaxID=360055 RepID=UPI0002FF8BA6|nr:putative hydro-lyase [Zavarzinella formosa]
MSQAFQTAGDVRMACRVGELTGPTTGYAAGYEQANLVIVPKEFAFDFLLFCHRNSRACPLLDVTDIGDPEPKRSTAGADLRTDLPKYRVWRDGRVSDEPTNLRELWRDDLVSFLIGCSFTFEHALLAEGIPVRHLEQGRNVPMFNTGLECQAAGRFAGPLVVSMRPMLPMQALAASKICERFPRSHGGPIHVGDSSAIGIHDITKPDYGDPVDIRPGELPVFWACGVTPQAALMRAKLPFAITHAPGHMFLTDLRSGT